MDLRGRQAEISPTERRIPNDPDKTLVAPRFDEKSVQSALPAVPLTLRGKAHTSLPVILLCVVAGLLGGLVVGLAFLLWQNNGSPRAETAAVTRQTGDAPANPATATSNPAATAPTPQAENADARGPQGDGQTTPPQTQEAQPKGADSAHTQETAAPARDAARAAAGVAAQAPPQSGDDAAVGEAVADGGTRGELRAALGDWVAATNARDIGRQMQFYAPTVNAFYLARNASRESVRAEKRRAFASADTVSVQTSEPDIRLSRDGQTAVMRFRKRYRIGERAGEVLQELRWHHTPAGWKIVGERDLRVLQ